MPMRRKKGRKRKPHKTRRVAQRRLRRPNGLSTLALSSPTGMPDRIFVKLRLKIDVAFTNTAGGTASAVFIANSGFDPTLSISAGQPYLWDQWSALYNQYRVHKMGYRIEPTISSTNVTTTSVREVTVLPSTSATAFTDHLLINTQPYAKSRRWQIGCGRAPTLKGVLRIPHLLGVTKERYRVDNVFTTTVTASPNTQLYFHVYTYDPVGVVDVNTNAGIWLTFHVEFFDRARSAVSVG